MRIVLVCTWETSIITMRYILGLTSVKFRFTLIQARVYIRITNDDMHSLFSNLNYANGIRLKCGTSRKMQTGDTNKWLVMSVQQYTRAIGNVFPPRLYFQSYGRFIFSESLECNFIWCVIVFQRSHNLGSHTNTNVGLVAASRWWRTLTSSPAIRYSQLLAAHHQTCNGVCLCVP